MQSVEKINKASFNHFSNVKNVVLRNISVAVQNGSVKVDQEMLPTLLALVNNSLDEGYSKGLRVFDKEIAAAIKPTSTDVITTKKKLIGMKI